MFKHKSVKSKKQRGNMYYFNKHLKNSKETQLWNTSYGFMIIVFCNDSERSLSLYQFRLHLVSMLKELKSKGPSVQRRLHRVQYSIRTTTVSHETVILPTALRCKNTIGTAICVVQL